MPKQNRTEFRVLQAGKERRLFTISETSDGSLVVLQNTKTSNFGSVKLTEVGDLHVTGHSRRLYENLGIHGHKFKTTHRTQDGRLYERSVIVRASEKRPKLVWILDSAIFGALMNGQYDIEKDDPKVKEVVPLLSYLPFEDALHYSLVVHDPTVQMPRIQGFGMYTHKFTALALTIYVTFSAATPDPKTGHLDGTAALHHYTQGGALTVNGKLVTPQGKIEAPLHVRNLERILQVLHLDLANKYSSLDISNQRGRRITPRDFHRWPTFGEWEGAAYGVMAQLGSPTYSAPAFVDGTPKPKGYVQESGSTLLLSDATLNPSLIKRVAELRENRNKD